MEDRSARRWVLVSLILQALGYVFDAVWHGLLRPGAEPTTVGDMVRHLSTVHLLLYLGAVSVLVSTSRALLRQIRRGAIGLALPIAVAGAVLVATAAPACSDGTQSSAGSGITPFGMSLGSSTAARSASRSPARNAASIFLNFAASAHRSSSFFIRTFYRDKSSNTEHTDTNGGTRSA